MDFISNIKQENVGKVKQMRSMSSQWPLESPQVVIICPFSGLLSLCPISFQSVTSPVTQGLELLTRK